jgi:hypothetical protein
MSSPSAQATVNVSGATMNDTEAVEFETVLPRTVLLRYLLSTPMEEIERAAGPAFADRNADEKAAICAVLTHRLQDLRLITRMSDF